MPPPGANTHICPGIQAAATVVKLQCPCLWHWQVHETRLATHVPVSWCMKWQGDEKIEVAQSRQNASVDRISGPGKWQDPYPCGTAGCHSGWSTKVSPHREVEQDQRAGAKRKAQGRTLRVSQKVACVGSGRICGSLAKWRRTQIKVWSTSGVIQRRRS